MVHGAAQYEHSHGDSSHGVDWNLWSQHQQKGIKKSNLTVIQLHDETVKGYSTY